MIHQEHIHLSTTLQLDMHTTNNMNITALSSHVMSHLGQITTMGHTVVINVM